jgi:hypothetical protein
MIPANLKRQLHEDNQRFKAQFNSPEIHRQVDAWLDKNEEDSRELLVVSCWFLGKSDSERMWQEYGGLRRSRGNQVDRRTSSAACSRAKGRTCLSSRPRVLRRPPGSSNDRVRSTSGTRASFSQRPSVCARARRLSPGAQAWFEKLIKRIVDLCQLPVRVSRSGTAHA